MENELDIILDNLWGIRDMGKAWEDAQTAIQALVDKEVTRAKSEAFMMALVWLDHDKDIRRKLLARIKELKDNPQWMS